MKNKMREVANLLGVELYSGLKLKILNQNIVLPDVELVMNMVHIAQMF